MKLSWMMNERLIYEVTLGLAPELGGVPDQDLETLEDHELAALAAWLEGRTFAGPDREAVAELIAARKSRGA